MMLALVQVVGSKLVNLELTLGDVVCNLVVSATPRIQHKSAQNSVLPGVTAEDSTGLHWVLIGTTQTRKFAQCTTPTLPQADGKDLMDHTFRSFVVGAD